MDSSYKFARNFVNTNYEDIPEDAVAIAKREILDILGVALGGCRHYRQRAGGYRRI